MPFAILPAIPTGSMSSSRASECGAHDPLADTAWAAHVTELLPSGELVTVAGAAHAAHDGVPETVAELIDGFTTTQPSDRYVALCRAASSRDARPGFEELSP
ncbi:hypothetical protein [Streptomyces sp. NPDC059943]|uniref:hypothetical protein n=1 Tax=Streptomyces sp. NPDC059943 TaxID=3347010 RepID=UPI00364DC6BF